MPFEIIQGTSTPDNFSGLEIVFKGNFEDREIIKDAQANEIINIKADEIFGENGTAVFEAIIDIYNLFTYNSDGTTRGLNDQFTLEDMGKFDEYQQKIAYIYDDLVNVTARNGARIDRLSAIGDQLNFENTRLKELRSAAEDTDMAASTLNLMKEETALQYTLQVGARLIPQSLFDFLG